MTKFLYNKITINIWQETILYPNRTQRHLKNPYKAHNYRLCRDLPFYSNSSLQSCCIVFFVGSGGRKQEVLSDFYLLRGFLGDCIVILLSVPHLIFTTLLPYSVH